MNLRIFRKIKGQYGPSRMYYNFRNKESIREDMVFLEAGQGKNKNGSMFALLREIVINDEWKFLKPVFVVTDENIEEVKQFFGYYNFDVELVVRNSKLYCKYLATAKYLITDNSFPPYFFKREEQIYLNTWHGTPLKTLGKSDIKNATSLANIQKNYMMCDYALFPNEFTENVFKKDYMLEKLFSGKILLCDYPRNSIFLQEKCIDRIKEECGLTEKQIIAYMPTWRGAQRKADITVQVKQLEAYFSKLDQLLDDHQEFYVNLHFLIGNVIDYTQYKHIQAFPNHYETYDFLSICDILVTDYSSVFFDFAVTNKKVILFPYDYEDYMENRGTYINMQELPFPIVYSLEELVNEFSKDFKMDQKFVSRFCKFAQVDIPNKILKLLVNNNNSNLCIKPAWNSGKDKTLLLYCGNLKNKQINRQILDYLRKQKDKQSFILCFRGKITDTVIDFMNDVGNGADFLALVRKYEMPFIAKIIAYIRNNFTLLCYIMPKKLQNAYENEKRRLFFGYDPKAIINFSCETQHINFILAQFECYKEFICHPEKVVGWKSTLRKYRNMMKSVPIMYDKILKYWNRDIKELWRDEEKETFYNRDFYIGNIFRKFRNRKTFMEMKAIAVAYSLLPDRIDNLYISVAEDKYSFDKRFALKIGKNKWLIGYRLRIPYENLIHADIQNKVCICYSDDIGYKMCQGIRYQIGKGKRGKGENGPVKAMKETETAMYFRQTKNNLIYLTIRKMNMTDAKIEQFKLFLAYYLSKITFRKKIILLFEKESSRYEESASVLYEKLIDEDYNNVYFILDYNYAHMDQIPDKYRKNILRKTSFKHYYYFFKAKTFLGSEALVHAIDLRIANKYAVKKLNDPNINYVFLQHGVMYMISLNSESRKFFKPLHLHGKYRVVTSSKMEAKHFIELGGYEEEMMYVCGLPKFDRNQHFPNADKIVIMPTWRPWEYNDVRYNFIDTKYYKMLCRIFECIPDGFRDKVVILPHPLFFDAIKDLEFPLKQYLDCETKYDDILKETKILITDYSSISYDAFYRGCNVIFYWEEKEECLAMYGQSTQLMLNRENTFGDICMSTSDLEKVFMMNYLYDQKDKYISNYRKIVEFHDGKNTERLLSMLEKDKIVQRG